MNSPAWFMFVVVTLACSACGAERQPDTNLLLITLDTTRADRLGCYGYAAAKTPHLDGMAAAGVSFDEAHSPAPMTLPAHATMLTGLLPPEHGARVNGVHRLVDEVPTLGERLGERGYRTGAFVAAFVLDERFGLGRGFDHYDDDLTGAYEQETPEGLSRYRPGELVVDSALAWLGSEQGPFFAWVHLYDPHFPWHAHGAGEAGGAAEAGTYDGEVTYMDAQVGRLLAYLDEQGLRDRTLVMAVADHGEGLGDHHEVEHAYLLNEEVLRIPWLVTGPGVQAGHRVPALVSLQDLQPTALEMLGLEGGGMRGRSLASALAGEPIEDGESYAETELPWTSYRWAPQYSLTTPDWKYIRTPQPELYARATDRAELANLAVARASLLEELDARLSALESTLVVRRSDLVELSAEESEQLAALGYSAGEAGEGPDEDAELADVKQRLGAKDLSSKLRRGIATGALAPMERVDLARRLVAMSPETPVFHNQLGEALVDLGDFASALASFETVVELVPTDAGAHYALGDALQQLGRTPEARGHLELALELVPEMAAAHVGMGNVLRSEGRPDLAAGEYTEALRLQPEYAEAHYNLAQTFMDRGLAEEAIEHFGLALEQKPGWALAHARLANLQLGLGRPELAVPHFEEALAQYPRDVDLTNDLGVAHEQLGRRAKAHAQYLRAAQLAPKFFRPRVNLGNLAFLQGEHAAALKHYEAALTLAPEHPETSARLARFLATHPLAEFREPERALALAQRATELTGGTSARVLDTLAAAQAAGGNFVAAMATAEQARKRAELEGDALLAQEVQARWALYAVNQPFVLERRPAGEVAPGAGLLQED